jgi:DNA-directed RNA polymerase subunit F
LSNRLYFVKMEIQATDIGLSNLEVLELMKSQRETRPGQKLSSALKGRITLQRRFESYMRNMSGIHSMDKVEQCLREIGISAGSKLGEEELLQIVNLIPTTPIEFQMCLTSRDTQFSETEIQDILNIVLKYFPNEIDFTDS